MATINTTPLRLVIGSDSAGYSYKAALVKHLSSHDLVASIKDIGVSSADASTAYPNIAVEAGKLVVEGVVDRALLICGTVCCSSRIDRDF